ncbi:MAG: ferredoxin [Gaiellaceae bacterium]
MTYRIEIDPSLCSGFGSCEELAPQIFAVESGVGTVRVHESDDPIALEARDACPMGAISVEEVASV